MLNEKAVAMTELDTRMALVEQNYENLARRLEKVEEKIDQIHIDIKNSNNSLIKVIVGAAGSIVTGLLSLIVVILMGM